MAPRCAFWFNDTTLLETVMHKRGAILLVDDDETVQEFGAMALSGLGREVLLASDGSQCLQVIKRRGADIELIVLDVRMPDMNGDDVVRQLRGDGVATPVLLCSGFEMAHADVLQTGASAYLSKPFRMRQLADTCRGLLQPL